MNKILLVVTLWMGMMITLSATGQDDVKKALDSVLKEEGINLTPQEYDKLLAELIEHKNKPTPSKKPDKTWVNNTIEVTFDDVGGRNINGKTKQLKLLGYKTDPDGYTYFSVKDLTLRDPHEFNLNYQFV